jgi:hypothetical protein
MKLSGITLFYLGLLFASTFAVTLSASSTFYKVSSADSSSQLKSAMSYRNQFQSSLDSSFSFWEDLKTTLLNESLQLTPNRRRIVNEAEKDFSLSLTTYFPQRLQRAYQTHDSLLMLFRLDPKKLTESEFHKHSRGYYFLLQADFADTILTLQDSLSALIESFYLIEQSEKNLSLLPAPSAGKTKEPSHFFNIQSGFQSRSVWRGIDQNNGNGAYSISADYQYRLGLSASISAVNLIREGDYFDQYTFSIGYQNNFGDVSISAFLNSYRFSAASPQARAYIARDISTSLSYDNPIVVPTVFFTYAIPDSSGSKNDAFLTIDLSHAFTFENFFSGDLTLQPSVSADYGIIRTIVVRRNSRPAVLLSESSVFSVTNYNLSLSTIYSRGFFSFIPDINYTIPINTDQFIRTRNRRRMSSKTEMSNLFYFGLGISISF